MKSEEKSKLLQEILDNLGSGPSGPIYSGTHKQLAELCLSSGDFKEAVFHLCESHGPTLRTLTNQKLQRFLREKNAQQSDVQIMRDALAFSGEWSDGVGGLHKRLSTLPTDWSAVQLTLQWDPLSRFPPRNRNISRGQGIFLSRLSFGELSHNDDLQCVLLPAHDVDQEGRSVMAAMKECLSRMDQRGQGSRSHIHEECSLLLEACVKDLEKWIGGWHFLFLGYLTNEKLMSEVRSAVDSHIDAYSANTDTSVNSAGDKSTRVKNVESKHHVPKGVLRWLYLIASNPFMHPAQIFEVLSSILESNDFALYLSKKVVSVIECHKTSLMQTKRHPVILILDEDLDILPFEVLSNLESQVFTRVPSIHFLHALYNIHKSTTLKKGINLEKGYYLINPSRNLPQLDALLKSLSCIPSFKKWKGVQNVESSSPEILKGLQENDIFLYCGHGGGDQYVPRNLIEKGRMKAVALLFGCSSSRLEDLGGRVEMVSLSYSYLIAGSPCVVGMLWPVLDRDINAMTKELFKVWCVSDAVKTTGISYDLHEALYKARKCATKFLNKAAIIVRGLPVSSNQI